MPADSPVVEAVPAPARPADLRPRLTVLALAGVTLAVACALPALVVSRDRTPESWPGYHPLLLGGLGLFIGQFGWLANVPAAIAAIAVLARAYRFAAGLCVLALLLAAHSLALFHQEIPANEGGVGPPYLLQRFGPGFYLWLASMAVLLGGALWLHRRGGGPRRPPRPARGRGGQWGPARVGAAPRPARTRSAPTPSGR